MQIYKEQFAPVHSLCFGLLGDTTANLLWRIENGELNTIKPKVPPFSSPNTELGMLR